jgi:NTP pyrophosphatase (non-canonical NTP hydrolase)
MLTVDQKLISVAVNAVTATCHMQSVKQGWWQGMDIKTNQYIVPAKLCLVHSEISEAMEGHRKDLMDSHLPHRKAIEVELADALIRIHDLAGALELDLGAAVVEKLAYNLQRADHKIHNREEKGGKAY